MSRTPAQAAARTVLHLALRLPRWVNSTVRVSAHEITPRQLHILQLIELGTTHGDLARRLGITARVITGLIDRIEDPGLVRRVPAHPDRRVIQLELTGVGAEVRDQLTDEVPEQLAQRLAGMDDADGPRMAEALVLLDRVLTRREEL